MPKCSVDKSIERKSIDGFDFPLGAYPIEEMKPREGYTLTFESADSDTGDGGMGSGGSGGSGRASGSGGGRAGGEDFDPDREGGPEDFEQWPDRYVFDIVIRHSRLEALCRTLWAMMPGRMYPIVDVLGVDAFREIDPYVAYDLVGMERFLEGIRLFRGYLMEDGLVGFGGMSEEPFMYVFVDEHKIVTVRVEAELKEKVEKLLAAFDLEQVEQIAGADAAAHEHRGVLEAPGDRPDLLSAEEIVEELRDLWGLTLNVDPSRNVDDQSNDLGITGWRCVVRLIPASGDLRYVEVLLSAGSLSEGENLAAQAAQSMFEDLLEEEPLPLPLPKPKPLAKPKATDESAEAPDVDADDDDDADNAVEIDVLTADRIKQDDFVNLVQKARAMSAPPKKGVKRVKHAIDFTASRIFAARWMM